MPWKKLLKFIAESHVEDIKYVEVCVDRDVSGFSYGQSSKEKEYAYEHSSTEKSLLSPDFDYNVGRQYRRWSAR